MRFLLVYQGRSRGFDLKEGQEALVGRSLEAQFFLSAPSISRKHCVLRSTRNGLELSDVSSRKDCFVNGRPVAGSVLLADGCVIQIGALAFSVEFELAAQAKCERCGIQEPDLVAGPDGVASCRACFAASTESTASDGGCEALLAPLGYQELVPLGGVPPSFKAENHLGQLVTLVLVPFGASGPEMVARVRAEARKVARLSHESILPLLDVKDLPGHLLVVTGYLEAETLDVRVARDGPLEATKAVQIAREILAALAYAEASGVRHKDLRPGQILLPASGRVVVRGFAIATELQAMSLTLSRAGNEESAFVAPEKFLDGEATSPQADVYSAGAVLHYMLTGRHPYPNISPAEFVWNVGLTAPPKLDLSGVPSALTPLMQRMLALDLAERPKTVKETLAAIEAAETAMNQGRIEGAFTGDELFEFLQLIAFHEKTGSLDIRSGTVNGRLLFHRGALAAAESGDRQGMDAIRHVVSRRSGRFSFVPIEVSRSSAGMQLKVSVVLMDLARTADESGDWGALKVD